MEINGTDLVVLLGILLSFFLVLLIFSSRAFRHGAQLWFALAILSLTMCLTYTWFEAQMPTNGLLELISWEFLFPFAFLRYVLKATHHPLRKHPTLHLLALPCMVFSAFHLVDFCFDIDVYDWLAGGDSSRYELLLEGIAITSLLFSLALIGWSCWLGHLAENLPTPVKKWLRFNSLALWCFLVVWAFSDPISYLLDVPLWNYLLVLMAVYLAVNTYLGVHWLHRVSWKAAAPEVQWETLTAPVETTLSSPLHLTDGSSQPVSISSKAKEKLDRLDALMVEQHLYTQPNLSRTAVAETLGISEGYLSEVLKIGRQCNFNDYVNGFRVDHVIRMFESRTHEVFSIEAIGSEAGFKTKSVFYNAFKKVTGKTPGAYRKTQKGPEFSEN